MAVRFLHGGDTALVVEFGDRVDRALNDRVIALEASVREAAPAGVVETVPTFRSLMVHYDPLQTTAAELEAAIRMLLDQSRRRKRPGRLWRIPACYEGDWAPDLAEVAERTGLAPGEVVRLHTGARYHVYMLGFLPGYPYMGDLPAQLVLPRRRDPRLRVPAGSVAIATTLTAVYAYESPGGWHLIGTTPVPLFDVDREPPTLLAAGDAVAFEPIDAAAFGRLSAAAEAGELLLAPEPLAP